MLKKKLRVLNLLEICCAVMIGIVLLAFVILVNSGTSGLQTLWFSLPLSQNILLWIVISVLKKKLMLDQLRKNKNSNNPFFSGSYRY